MDPPRSEPGALDQRDAALGGVVRERSKEEDVVGDGHAVAQEVAVFALGRIRNDPVDRHGPIVEVAVF